MKNTNIHINVFTKYPLFQESRFLGNSIETIENFPFSETESASKVQKLKEDADKLLKDIQQFISTQIKEPLFECLNSLPLLINKDEEKSTKKSIASCRALFGEEADKTLIEDQGNNKYTFDLDHAVSEELATLEEIEDFVTNFLQINLKPENTQGTSVLHELCSRLTGIHLILLLKTKSNPKDTTITSIKSKFDEVIKSCKLLNEFSDILSENHIQNISPISDFCDNPNAYRTKLIIEKNGPIIEAFRKRFNGNTPLILETIFKKLKLPPFKSEDTSFLTEQKLESSPNNNRFHPDPKTADKIRRAMLSYLTTPSPQEPISL